MPRRATSLLDDRIEPTLKKTLTPEKNYRAVFLVSVMGKPGRLEETMTISAPNSVAALKKARIMCHNPMIFPAGCVARIPEANITELHQEEKMRSYEAVFEVYRNGEMNRRPHTIRMKISAKNRHAAYEEAQDMCTSSLAGKYSADIVKCPLKNIRMFK